MKNRQFVVSLLVAVSLIVAPFRPAVAALPALALVSARAVSTAGAVTEISQLSGLVNTIGIAALMFSFSNGKSISLQVTNTSKGGQYATPVPEPSAPETESVIDNALNSEVGVSVPTVPSAGNGFVFQGTTYVFSTLAAAASSFLSDIVPGGGSQATSGPPYIGQLTYIDSPGSHPYCNTISKGYFMQGVVPFVNGPNQVNRCVAISGASPCSRGYFFSGGECVLDDPYLAKQDNHTEVVRYGATWAPPSDNDADPLPESVRISTSGDKLTFPVTMPDGSIKTYRATLSSDPYPGFRLEEFVNVDPSNVSINSSFFDELGMLRESSHVQQPGQLTEADPYSYSSSTTTNPGNGTSTNIQFPTDYARIGEAGAAANVVKASVDSFKGQFELFRASWEAFKTLFQTLHEKITGTTELADPSDVQLPENQLKTATAGLSSWSMPSHASECPAPSMTLEFFGGKTYTLNSHCQIAEQNRDLIGALMRIMFAVMAVFIVLGA